MPPRFFLKPWGRTHPCVLTLGEATLEAQQVGGAKPARKMRALPGMAYFSMLNRSNIQMIFFDAAGTLFEVRGSVGEIYARVARPYGFEAAPEEIERRFAREFRRQPPLAFPPRTPEAERLVLEREWWRDLVRAVFAELGPFPRFDEFFVEVFELFRGREGWRLYEDVAPALAALKEHGLRLGVISNFDSRLDDVLRALRLDHYFGAVHLSSREGAAKPDPAIFQAALAQNAIAPSQALHVGDSWREDAEGAAAVGIYPVLLDRRGRFTEADHLTRLTRLDQLVELLV